MRWVGWLFVVLFWGACATRPSDSFPSRPNIIIIQADDLGFNDLGIHGNRLVETPHLDRMASQSLRYQQFYVNPVCAATRASLLTGRHFLRTGVSHVHGGKDYLHLSEVTIADVLQRAGYRTGIWGKWHVGKTQGYLPRDRGFDEAYVADLYRHRHSAGTWNGARVTHNRWADEVIVDYAIDFIERSDSQPFFAYLSSMTCHGALDAPEELVEKYRTKGLNTGLATLYAMVELLDRETGRLLEYLQESGRGAHTLVFFLSDNGPAINRRELTDEDRQTRRVNPFKGFKGNIWENGVMSPLFAYWPGVLSTGINDAVADVTDLFPTIAQLAGAGYDHEIDGLALAPFGQDPAHAKYSFNYANPAWPPTDQPWTPEGILDEYRPVDPATLNFAKQIISVRQGDYKLLLNAAENMNSVAGGSLVALFNIRRDPYEEVNLLGQDLPEEVILHAALERWFSEEIVTSDHAFAMPLHVVSKDTSVIYAVGANNLSPHVTPTFNWLAGWSEAGSFADYETLWEQGADYQLILHHSTVQNARFEVQLGANRLPVTLASGSTTVTLQDVLKGRQTLTLRKLDSTSVVDRIDKWEIIRINRP